MTFCTSKIDEAAFDDPPKRVDWFRSVMGMLELLDTSQDLWRLRSDQREHPQLELKIGGFFSTFFLQRLSFCSAWLLGISENGCLELERLPTFFKETSILHTQIA